ncbi:hypothetical protein AVEN_151358-1 [Araneus ventricosus]|uniref:Uncharacterized protein n=1 Tax=Araneus ventricosus TaxID=182803 RepID=A0A4Y2CA24_ARAVE|nr:hypothetical protein AVEN_151358-1 [Araneus ventricosus]
MHLRRNRRRYEQFRCYLRSLLSVFERNRSIGLRQVGWLNGCISQHVGRSDMVVVRCWQQWIGEGTVIRRNPDSTYVDNILQPVVLPMLLSRPGAIYQLDILHIMHDSPNNVYKDVMSIRGLQGHKIMGHVGKATSAVSEYHRTS